jgi:hypothetical protein
MLLKLPIRPRLKVFDICTNDHKEFNGTEIIGEPVNIGVRTPQTINKYIVKDGYTYLWELNKLYDGSDYYSIWLLYPKDNRPTEIEIEDYEETEIIDAVDYERFMKAKQAEETRVKIQAEIKRVKENTVFCDKGIDLDYFTDYIIENTHGRFNDTDRGLLFNVIKGYFK